MMNRILITGGTGFIGHYLTKFLISKGYRVSILSRSIQENTDDVSYFLWDVKNKLIDKTCLHKVQTIIHLSGENVASGKWTSKRKEMILNSRIQSTELLYDMLCKESHNIKNFISASATGIYGSSTTENIFNEDDIVGTDFLAKVCSEWEFTIFKMNSIGIRTVALRTGVVLAKDNGALEKMTLPFKLGVGSAIGTGKQYIPWIHIEDLCKLYLFAIENDKISGSYNAVVGDSTNNVELSSTLAKSLNRPFFMPNIPKVFFSFVFGEMAVILTEGSRVSSEKIKKEGFVFSFPKLNMALENLFS